MFCYKTMKKLTAIILLFMISLCAYFNFSVFNTNFVSGIGKYTRTSKENYTLNRGIDNEQAYKKFEAYNLDKLMKIYEYVKSNKILPEEPSKISLSSTKGV